MVINHLMSGVIKHEPGVCESVAIREDILQVQPYNDLWDLGLSENIVPQKNDGSMHHFPIKMIVANLTFPLKLPLYGYPHFQSHPNIKYIHIYIIPSIPWLYPTVTIKLLILDPDYP
jgi:hypothetical protein